MNEVWIPVLFAAIIVGGVVGGTLIQMVLKQLLPLLRSMAEQRTQLRTADLEQLRAGMQAMERRMADTEAEQRRIAEETDFVRQLLAPAPGPKQVQPLDRENSVRSTRPSSPMKNQTASVPPMPASRSSGG